MSTRVDAGVQSLIDTRLRHYGNMKQMDPHKIHFTQDHISNTFSNGVPISWTIRMLQSNEILPRELPLIRIGWFNNRWTSIDNRRLFCFKTAKNINIIPVRIVEITQEFHKKHDSKCNGLFVKVIIHPNRQVQLNTSVCAFDPISSCVIIDIYECTFVKNPRLIPFAFFNSVLLFS